VRKDPRAWEIIKPLRQNDLFGGGQDESASEVANEAISEEMNMAMIEYMPLRGAMSFGGNVSPAEVQAIVDKLNALD
jgi:beta-glucosidase